MSWTQTIWGTVTEIIDLGVVAEDCPHCGRPMSCLLRSVSRADYIFFVKVSVPYRECSCLCTGCLKAFPGQAHWHYAAVVPIQEAKNLPLQELLATTNPVLADRLQFKEQIRGLGGDARFATAYEQLEALRPGVHRSELLRQLLDWDRLAEDQRKALGQQIGARARAWKFACQMAPGFPESAGCLTLAVVTALLVAPVMFLVPTLRSWLWGIVAVGACLMAVTLINQVLMKRRVCQWTKSVLIPAAQDASISLDGFVVAVDDVPGSRLGLADDLWPIKDELNTIRGVLKAEGKLESRL